MKLLYLLPLVLLLPAVSAARTLRVEQDGSGDFTNIQPAVDAAAPRDTVLVGSGRYDTFWLFDPVLHWEVIVGVSVDSLTIIGIDRESVIIGPTTLYPAGQSADDRSINTSIGIAYGSSNHWAVVENITFVNTWRGVNLYPSGEIRNCTFRGMWTGGVIADKALQVLIERCDAYDCVGGGFDLAAYGEGDHFATIQTCRVEGSQTGYYISHPNAVIEDCVAIGCNSGYALVSGAAAMRNVIADRCYGGIVVNNYSVLSSLMNATCRNSVYGDLAVFNGGVLLGTRVNLEGGGLGNTIWVFDGILNLHDSHVMPSQGPSVYVQNHAGPDDAIDLTGNYWGTTSADSIAAWIWDSHDDPSILTTVRYEPFSPIQVQNEHKSMSDVKAMFRR